MTGLAGALADERVRPPLRPRMRAEAAAALRERFPAREVPDRVGGHLLGPGHGNRPAGRGIRSPSAPRPT